MQHQKIAKLTLLLALMLAPAAWGATGVAVADTYISQINGSVNYGAAAALNVGPGSSALVQLDVSTLQSLGLQASNIQRATLTLYVKALVAGGLDFHLANQSWFESTTTFNNFNLGLIGATFLANVPVSGTGFVTVDVTNQVRDWATGIIPNNGLVITAAVAQPGTTVQVDSKENTATSHPAYLDVTLTATGATGPSGPSGPAGAQGATGPSGPAGPQGATGPSGPLGPQGATGPSGPLGPQGATGPSGPLGPQGATGPSGPLGPQGATGPSGPLGLQGPSGPSGPLGPQGIQGPSGPSGPAGPATAATIYTASGVTPLNASWYEPFSSETPITSPNNSPIFAGVPVIGNCTVDNLTISAVLGGASGTTTIIATLLKNGASTGMSVQVTNSGTIGVFTTSAATSPTVSAVAGDHFGLSFTQTNTAPIVRYGVAMRCK